MGECSGNGAPYYQIRQDAARSTQAIAKKRSAIAGI
jgi:hypothetical protein